MIFKKIGKKLFLIFGGLAALVVILLVVAYLNLNTIATEGIERALSNVLQVDVTVEDADVALFGGQITLRNLVIGNPEGFETEKAFSAGEIKVKADLKSFTTDEPTIRLISIDEPQIVLEQGFRSSNFGRLIENASRFEEKQDAEKSPEAQKQMKIDKVIVDRASVAISAPALKGNAVTFPIPRIEMNDLGGKKERVGIAESIKLVLSGIVKAIGNAASGIPSIDVKETFSSTFDLAGESLEKVSDTLTEGIGEAGKGLKGVTGTVTDIFRKDSDAEEAE